MTPNRILSQGALAQKLGSTFGPNVPYTHATSPRGSVGGVFIQQTSWSARTVHRQRPHKDMHAAVTSRAVALGGVAIAKPSPLHLIVRAKHLPSCFLLRTSPRRNNLRLLAEYPHLQTYSHTLGLWWYAATPASVIMHPAALHLLMAFPKTSRETPIDRTTLTLPRTCRVTGLVRLVMTKLHKLRKNATRPR